MKTEITKANQREPKSGSQDYEALLFGAALKTRCGYRLLKIIRERDKNNFKTDKNLKS